jgi:hypothetical protein
MLIGISGYSGSGKDTVGRIIQYISCKSKKDIKLKDALKIESDWWREEQSGWEIKKFAGKLKQIASILTGIPIQNFESQGFKNTLLGPEWDVNKYNHRTNDVEKKKMSVREFLQKLGTDGLRAGLHDQVWINALFADYVPDEEGIYPNWIITDVRFPNEFKAIKDQGGFVIRLNRPGYTPVNAHASEIALDDYQFDETIVNKGDLYELMDTIETTLKRREYYAK